MEDQKIRFRVKFRDAYTYPEPYETKYRENRPFFRPRIQQPLPFTEFYIFGVGTEKLAWKQVPEEQMLPDAQLCGFAPYFYFFFAIGGGGSGAIEFDSSSLSLLDFEGKEVVASFGVPDALNPNSIASLTDRRLDFLLYSFSILSDSYQDRQLRQLPPKGTCELVGQSNP